MGMRAIIGGSGLAQFAELADARKQVMRTPYGEPSGPITIGRLCGEEIAFLARHGYGHTIAPHEINYRANLWALAQLGVDEIVAVAAVGGIRFDLGPGELVLPDQIIDYTHNRKGTFFEGPDEAVTHIDFTVPYSQTLRSKLMSAAVRLGEKLHDGSTYACTQGPRLETAAEIRKLERDGCDVVGMTGMPEAALARELGIDYASLAVVANWAAGKGDSMHQISMAEIREVLNGAMQKVRRVLQAYVEDACQGAKA